MLPNEKAPNPEEETQQPNSQGKGEDDGDSPTPTPTDVNVRNKFGITFDDATAFEPASQSSSTYKEVLSQPASTLTRRNRLLWLQKRRAVGLWAQCDDCDQWRHLPHVLEAHELPAEWRCTMNPDVSYANCSVPEAPFRVRDEEDLIHNEYTAGSIVWARLAGWPWWPAMVDDEPDTEQFYWLDGFSDIPTHYNVTFFDENEATHAWIAPNQLKSYEKNRSMAEQVAKEKKYKKRLRAALTQAEDACKLSQQKRLTKYSFIARYSGTINSPRKVTKKELKRFNDRFKKRYNVQMDCASDESEDEDLLASKRKKKELPVKQNKIALGKGKKVKDTFEKSVKDVPEKRNAKYVGDAKKILTDKPDTSTVERTVKGIADKRNANDVDNVGNATSEKAETSKNVQNSQDVKQTSRPEDLMETEQIPEKDKKHIGIAVNEIPNENIDSETVPEAEGSFDNDTSDTYVPPNDLPTQSTYTEGTQSQSIKPDPGDTQTPVSEDFDLTLADTPKTGRPQDNIIFGRKLEDSMQQFEISQSQEVCTIPARVKPVFKPVFKTVFKTPNSLSVQVGSNATKTSTLESNDTSKTYVADTKSESESMESSIRETIKKIRTRVTSGGSDDYDF